MERDISLFYPIKCDDQVEFVKRHLTKRNDFSRKTHTVFIVGAVLSILPRRRDWHCRHYTHSSCTLYYFTVDCANTFLHGQSEAAGGRDG